MEANWRPEAEKSRRWMEVRSEGRKKVRRMSDGHWPKQVLGETTISVRQLFGNDRSEGRWRGDVQALMI